LTLCVKDDGRHGSTTLPIADGRLSFSALVATLGEPVDGVEAEDRAIPGPAGELAIRLYRTPGAAGPAVAFFHGGGFVFGDLDSHDTLCRGLARGSRATIVAVDYRRAPEAPFPAAFDDCVAATAWIAELGSGLVVAGDSAGGNLAAAVALHARDTGGPRIDAQLLLYPMLVPPHTADPHPGDSQLLTRAESHWFWGHYRPDGRYAVPGLVTDLAGLPPAHIVVAGIDPLRDEALAYAGALEAAGVPVRLDHYEEMLHGFLLCTRAHAGAREAIQRLGEGLWTTAR
jgi:acetyl esterase